MGKLAEFLRTNWMTVAAIILAVTAAFGLGWLTRGEIKKAPIIIEKYSQN